MRKLYLSCTVKFLADSQTPRRMIRRLKMRILQEAAQTRVGYLASRSEEDGSDLSRRGNLGYKRR